MIKLKNCRVQNRYPGLIKEVRGIGLMIGVEFFNSLTAKVCHQRCIENQILFGLFGKYNHVLRIEPSYTIEKEEIDGILRVLGNTLRELSLNTIPLSTIEKAEKLIGLGKYKYVNKFLRDKFYDESV